MVFWSIIEDTSAVVCINLPPCRHLLSKLFPGQQHSVSSSVNNLAHGRSRGGIADDDSNNNKNRYNWSEKGTDARSVIGVTTTITASYSDKVDPRDRWSRSWSTVSTRSSRSSFVTSAKNEPLPPLPFPLRLEKEGKREGGSVADDPWAYTGQLPRRPHTAHVFQRIEVDIDRSELGLWDVFRKSQWFDGRVKRSAMSWIG